MSNFLTGGDPALVIRIKNVADVVKRQGGATGAAAYAAIPNVVTEKVYSTVQEQLSTKFKEQGVDADVQVTSAPPMGKAPSGKRDFLTGAVVGAGAVVGGYYLYTRVVAKYVIPFLRSKLS